MFQHSLMRGLTGLSMLFLGTSCGQPILAAGNWSMNVTNGANECMVANWTVGETTSAIPLTIVQNGSALTGTVGGVVGTGATLLFGTNNLTGMVSGNRVDMRLTGRGQSSGACAYTPVIDFLGTVTGDTMVGELRWTYDTNSSPECAYRSTCVTLQQITAARPPNGRE